MLNRDTRWAHTFGKIMPIDLFDLELPHAFNFKKRKKKKKTVFVSCYKQYIIKQGMIVMKHDGLMEHFANEITNGMKLGKKWVCYLASWWQGMEEEKSTSGRENGILNPKLKEIACSFCPGCKICESISELSLQRCGQIRYPKKFPLAEALLAYCINLCFWWQFWRTTFNITGPHQLNSRSKS